MRPVPRSTAMSGSERRPPAGEGEQGKGRDAAGKGWDAPLVGILPEPARSRREVGNVSQGPGAVPGLPPEWEHFPEGAAGAPWGAGPLLLFFLPSFLPSTEGGRGRGEVKDGGGQRGNGFARKIPRPPPGENPSGSPARPRDREAGKVPGV